MNLQNPDEPVREEQFGTDKEGTESTEKLNQSADPKEEEKPAKEESEETEKISPAIKAEGDDTATETSQTESDDKAEKEKTESEGKEEEAIAEAEDEEAKAETEAREEEEEKPESDAKEEKETASDDEKKTEPEVKEVEPKPKPEPNAEEVKVKPEAKEEEAKAKAEAEAGEEPEVKEAEEDAEVKAGPQPVPQELPPVDYTGFTRRELIETLTILVEDRPIQEIRSDVDRIRSIFLRKTRKDREDQKAEFISKGGKEEDFSPADDELEKRLNELMNAYKRKKQDQARNFELEKQENLRKKYEIIEQIKDLVNREESINKTFQDFRELQHQWRSIGLVPQHSVKDLWENYHHNVEIFYDYIKINKELRDLDLKKNQELKNKLCEKAEALMLEPNPISAFRTLQTYHDQWREIGPVPREVKNDLWERFKEATSKINRRHHEYFQHQKDEQKKNLEAKTALCEKVEEIISENIEGFKGWENKAREVIEIQRMWRTIGFAPKKHNSKIYQRFREACDSFFQQKREFYAENKEQQQNNLQLKTELCVQAEALKDSTDWKETTEILKKLQRDWKQIGPVPRKHSDKIWKRFRAACDTFFENKAAHFSNQDGTFEENLKAKEELIAEIQAYALSEDVDEAFEKLKDFQSRWAEIGFVPYEKKDQIANDYRNALNQKFDKLQVDDEKKNLLKYKNKLDSMYENPRAHRKLRSDREKFLNKLKQLENDIVLWDNNIGFFAKSKNADSLIQEVQQKIDNAKKEIVLLEEKIRLIDESDADN